MTTATFPTAESALAYRQAHGKRMKALCRMTMPVLRSIESEHHQYVMGGPVTKEEFIGSILDTEYPAARLNEAIHVAWHRDGAGSTACEWCHPHGGAMCECPHRSEVAR